jgi:deoxycytidylate deaminase
MISKHIETLRLMTEDRETAFGYRVAAMLLHRNKIISFGWSQEKSHPFQQEFAKNKSAKFWHAETNAIFNARRKIDLDSLKKARLVVVRLKYSADRVTLKFGLARPCPGCARCIEAHGIKTVYYSLESTFEKPHYGVGEY